MKAVATSNVKRAEKIMQEIISGMLMAKGGPGEQDGEEELKAKQRNFIVELKLSEPG